MKNTFSTISRRRNHTKRTVILLTGCLLAASAMGIYAYQHFATGQPIAAQQAARSSLSSSANSTIESANLPWPSYGEAAIGAAGYNTATHGDQTPMPTASIAKVMTALAILKKMPLSTGEQGPMITLTQQDQDIYNYYRVNGGSLVPVKVGENITEYQALEAMLLPSANNMADTLADWAFGSISTYDAYANSLAMSYGMTNSNFTSASGFPPSTVSTAQDLVTLGKVALQNPVITQIVGESSAAIPETGTVTNTNSLLGMQGIDGIKTGNNDQDKGAFLGSRAVTLPSGQTIQLISVVMGAPSLQEALNDSMPILSTAAQNLGDATVNIQSAQYAPINGQQRMRSSGQDEQ